MVLLKNTGNLLPLDAHKLKNIVVIGPYAETASTGGGGSSHVQWAYKVTPVEGLQKQVGSGVAVTYVDGKDITLAAAAAKAADVAIVEVGDRQSEGADHAIELKAPQDDLVTAVIAANARTVVVIKSGGPVLMPWVAQAPAILEAWYPGEEDGNAVAEVLFGDFNPSGRLPITFPKAMADLPTTTPEQYPGGDGVVHYSEGVFVGYRYYDAKKIEPLFPFGFGLSYTTFAYNNLKIVPTGMTAGPTAGQSATVEFDIENSGKTNGAEVAEVYVGIPSIDGVAQPPKQLKAFKRIDIKRGKSTHVTLTLNARAFSYWDTASHGWKVAPGTYPIYVGSSSRDIKLQDTITVK